MTITTANGAGRRAIIIGAGIAGLTTAYYLRKRGVGVTIIEREKVVGGVIRSALANERYLLEHGPMSFLSSAESIIKLARELSIDGQLVSAGGNGRRRYVVRKGKLEAVPCGPKALLTSRALSWPGKLRLLCEPFIKMRREEDESVAAFVRRRGGEELLAALVDPFVSGIFAGDVEQLSAVSVFPQLVAWEEKYGSVMRGWLRERRRGEPVVQPTSFRWGMGTLTARLEEILRHDLLLRTTIESVERVPRGGLSVRVEAPQRTFEAPAVVIATPAWMAARLLASIVPSIISPLMSIPYVPLVVVHTVFPRVRVPHRLDGFGFLVPRREQQKVLGCMWASSLFPGRAPVNEALFTSYLGGATDPRAAELDDDEILSHVRTTIDPLLGITAEPAFVQIRRLVQAIPQYTIGHTERLAEITAKLAAQPGIFLTGNYFSGVSVAATIDHARATADRVLATLGVWSPKPEDHRP